jgi:hypothetical protein
MNIRLLKAIESSGIGEEIIAAVELIAGDRTAETPILLAPFVGYIEPVSPAPTDLERNTAIWQY